MSLKTSVMEFLKIDELKQNLIKLFEAKFELKKLEILEQAKPIIVDFVFGTILFVLCLITYTTFVGALGFYLGGKLLNSPALGLLFMGVLHLILLAIFYFNATAIKDKLGKEIGEKIDNIK